MDSEVKEIFENKEQMEKQEGLIDEIREQML